jgi:hypothetical protein
MASDVITCIPVFTGTGKGVEGILRFRLINLEGCIVGTANDRDLHCTPLK